jgi:hypothetical protein
MIVELRSSGGLFHHVRKGARAAERACARAAGYHGGVTGNVRLEPRDTSRTSRASVRGPHAVDDNLARTRVRDGGSSDARMPFAILVILVLITFFSPPSRACRAEL